MNDDDRVAVVRDILDSWSAQDRSRVESLFPPDGVLHIKAIGVIAGRVFVEQAVGLVGAADRVTSRMREYLAAGVDDLVIVPSATDEDPAGEHTLRSALGIAASLP